MARPLASVLAAVAAIALVASALPRASVAEDEITWYVVEMIVFERTSPAGVDAEAWTKEPGLPDLADAIELSVEGLSPEELTRGNTPEEAADAAQSPDESVTKPLAPLPRAYQLLPPEEYRLNNIREKLEKSSAYRPLLQVAWIQPGSPLENAPLVHIRNDNGALGAVAAGEAAAPSSTVNDTAFAAALSPHVSVARDPSKPALDGTVRVHRARYLHVEADLLYYRPTAGSTGGATETPIESSGALLADSPDTGLIEQLLAEDQGGASVFRLTERRRMRSKELHYLDHPLFGVLVEAWPLELPEAPPEPLPVENEGDSAPQTAPAQGQSTTGG